MKTKKIILLLMFPALVLADEEREATLKGAVSEIFEMMNQGKITSVSAEKSLTKSLVDYYRQMMVNKEAFLKERKTRLAIELEVQKERSGLFLERAKDLKLESVHRWEIETFKLLRMAELARDGMRAAKVMTNEGERNEFKRTPREQMIFNGAGHLAVFEAGLRDDKKLNDEFRKVEASAAALTRFEELLLIGDEIDKIGTELGWSDEAKKKHGAGLTVRRKWRLETKVK